AQRDTHNTAVQDCMYYGQVRDAITVEVPDHNRNRIRAGRASGRSPEAAVAVTEQDAYPRRVVIVDYGEVGNTIAIEVSYSHRDRIRAGGIVLRGLETTVPI